MDFIFERPEWHKRAKCRGMGADGDKPNPFFPKRGQNLDEVRAICNGCPVFKQCHEHQIDYDEDFGVWAGEGREGRQKEMKHLLASGRLELRRIGAKKPKNYT